MKLKRNIIIVSIVICFVLVGLIFLLVMYTPIYTKVDFDPLAENDGFATLVIQLDDGKDRYDIDKDVEQSASASLTQNEEYIFKNSKLAIEGRGNSTWLYEKKPYKIKFNEKTSLFGLEEAKDWVLLADFLDPTTLKNYSALTFANEIKDDTEFVPTPTHINLVINDDYLGSYVLCEQVEEKSGRLDLEDSYNPEIISYEEFECGKIPFYVEMTASANYGQSNDELYYEKGITPYPFEIKYPALDDRKEIYDSYGIEYDEANDYILNNITEYITAFCMSNKSPDTPITVFEQSLKFDEIADTAKFTDYMLINELFANSDALIKSIKLTRQYDGLIKMGPVWDFDGGYDGWTGDRSADNLDEKVSTMTMFQHIDNNIYLNFMKSSQAQSLINDSLDKMDAIFDNYLDELDSYSKKLKPLQELNDKVWPSHIYDSVWIENKTERMIVFLDNRFDNLKTVYSEIAKHI